MQKRFWRRWDWRFAGIFAGLIVLLYLPYLGVGWHVFGFLGGYAAQENIVSGQGIFLLQLICLAVSLPAIAAPIYLAGLAVVLAAIGAGMVFGPNSMSARSVSQRCLLLGGVLVLGISPHYPWYFAFLLVPACIVPSPATLYLVTASFLLYLNPTHIELFWPSIVFGPYAAFAAWQFFAPRPAMAAVQQGVNI